MPLDRDSELSKKIQQKSLERWSKIYAEFLIQESGFLYKGEPCSKEEALAAISKSSGFTEQELLGINLE